MNGLVVLVVAVLAAVVIVMFARSMAKFFAALDGRDDGEW